MIQILFFLVTIFCMGVLATLWQPKFYAVVIIVCASASAVIGWYVLSFNMDKILSQFLPSDPFAPVETIMSDTEYGFMVRYILYLYGWLIGLFYFGIVFGVSYYVNVRYGKKDQRS
jgi:hypothetical protein